MRNSVPATPPPPTLSGPAVLSALLNQYRRLDGRVESVRGTARPADPAGPNTKLKVTFFWPFAGDYWILDVDHDYRWALVGEPCRKYLWVLSREPRLNSHLPDRLLACAR